MGTTTSFDSAHPPKQGPKLGTEGDSRAPIHLEHPAAVVVVARPCFLPEAGEVLSSFEKEVYPEGGDALPKFLTQFSVWGPPGGDCKSGPNAGDAAADAGADAEDSDGDCGGPVVVMTAVFPREGIPRLAELCHGEGLILMRCELTAINPETNERMVFDLATAVANMIDTVPNVADRYSIQRRTEREGTEAYIACGLHEDELQAFIEQKRIPDG
jgi:hypothetical protein